MPSNLYESFDEAAKAGNGSHIWKFDSPDGGCFWVNASTKRKTEFNPFYLIPRMTVCDVTEMPSDSNYIKEARERNATVVEPKAIYMNQISALLKSITGKTIETSEFESMVETALSFSRPQ